MRPTLKSPPLSPSANSENRPLYDSFTDGAGIVAVPESGSMENAYACGDADGGVGVGDVVAPAFGKYCFHFS